MEKSLLNTQNIYLTTDYLSQLFVGTKAPQQKINYLLKKGELIRVKRNLYLLGPDYHRPYSREVLAGIIFGPSAISFEYALSFHGLIPERVKTVTSICLKRDKFFQTPVGYFSFRYLSRNRYPVGLEWHQTDLGNFLIASKEKAICDMAFNQKLETPREALAYCVENLRIDEEEIFQLDGEKLKAIADIYKRDSTHHLSEAITMFQNRRLKKKVRKAN